MSFRVVLLAALLAICGSRVLAQVQTTSCYAGKTFQAFTEQVVSITNQGCFNYFVGPVYRQELISLALSNNQITCDQNQNLYVLDSNWKSYYDFCGAAKRGVNIHMISYTGSYLILQFVNHLSQAVSSYIHYGIFNNLPSLPTQSPVISSAAPTSTAGPKNTCGVPAYQPVTTGMKIVGGFDAISNSLPWQVMVVTISGRYRYMCGGSLISNQWIVTAAHCVVGSGTTTIYMGAQNYNDIYDPSKSTGITVSKIIVNPGWNSNTMKNDIALMKLSKPVTFSDKIQPICLPSSDLATPGRYGMVSGWGDTSSGGSPAASLLEAIIPIRTLTSCGFQNVDVKTQICAGIPSANKPVDTCQGDSGGPLTLKDSNHFTLVGVVSYGGPCDGEGIYTNVFAFVDWIKQTMATQ